MRDVLRFGKDCFHELMSAYPAVPPVLVEVAGGEFFSFAGMEWKLEFICLGGVYTISPDELSFSEFQSRQFNRLFPAMPYLQPNQLQNREESLEFQFECFTPLIHLYL